MRFFNTAGPNNSQDHYCLPPLERFDLAGVLMLIGQKKHFVLHAPRQTGKTTSLLALRDHLNASGDYRCVYTNVEVGQSAREEVGTAMQAILAQLGSWAEGEGDGVVTAIWPEILERHGPHAALGEVLARWAAQSPRPLVVLIDEIDALILAAGLEQTWAYLDRCGAGEGHLVIFARRPGRAWEEKLFRRAETVHGRAITVWGM